MDLERQVLMTFPSFLPGYIMVLLSFAVLGWPSCNISGGIEHSKFLFLLYLG